MKRVLFCVAAVAVCGAGCEEAQWSRQSPGVNEWLVQTVHDQAINNAIIRQQTLYPYHFVVNGDELSSLGLQDMRVLASHYRQFPGQLSVRRGDAPEELYQKRVTRVLCVLQDAGVQTDRVKIADALPQGDGMSSEQVVQILERTASSPAAQGTPAGWTPATPSQGQENE
ncbi:MAG: hypothetical protein ACYS5V_16880 [Planctomycetota bacterium]|jgi:hypothetical protein